jgi:hypothetical protein
MDFIEKLVNTVDVNRFHCEPKLVKLVNVRVKDAHRHLGGSDGNKY